MKKTHNLFILVVSIFLAIGMMVLSGCGDDNPSTPPSVTVAVADSQATVSWTAVSGATSYNLYYGTTPGTTVTTGTKITGAVSPQVITGLTNGTVYYFVVTAVTSNGENAIAGEVSATPVPVPAKPSGITASGGDGKAGVSWSAVTGATSYNIYYATTPGVTTTNGTKVTNVTSPQDISGLSNGTTYYFVVTAVNAAGESGTSSEKPATPSATPQVPGDPSNVKVTSPSTGTAKVTWNLVPYATSYKVYYLESNSSVPTENDIITTGSSQTTTNLTLTITGLTSGSAYYFEVTAVNSAGESAGQSNPKSVSVQ